MESHSSWRPLALVAFLISMAFGEASFAQLQTGNLYGTVKDEHGVSLPGVTLTLTGAGTDQLQVSTEQGQFRFLGLSPGTYSLKAELNQHTPIEHSAVVINVGRNTNLDVVLPDAIGDTLTVTTEAAPLVDNRRISTGSTIVRAELEKIPSARDPWTVLASVPGVLTDRINVGGNESGRQSRRGRTGRQRRPVGLVGRRHGDHGHGRARLPPRLLRLRLLVQEMQVTTGGSDSSIATGGVVLNMVTKRGGDEWKGTGRFLVTDQDNQ
jgi:hypothetical protein